MTITRASLTVEEHSDNCSVQPRQDQDSSGAQVRKSRRLLPTGDRARRKHLCTKRGTRIGARKDWAAPGPERSEPVPRGWADGHRHFLPRRGTVSLQEGAAKTTPDPWASGPLHVPTLGLHQTRITCAQPSGCRATCRMGSLFNLLLEHQGPNQTNILYASRKNEEAEIPRRPG